MKILSAGFKGARWMAWVGLVCGVIYAFGGLIIDLLAIGLNRGTALAFMALVGMPLLFAVFGFLAGILLALMRRGVGAILGRTR